ncbi:MAG: hypothetical protein LUD53_07575, partial [Clostridiales bacterium]|nr:hypothetical protein [Clostridiales bacterium]
VAICNIGDSRIFRLSKGQMEQLSMDHVGVAPYGRKPPLSQNLGIPPTEMLIEPYAATAAYREGDIYLICSDGLTDMLSTNQIAQVLGQYPIETAAGCLLEKALERGGRDNITIILCRTEARGKFSFLGKRRGVRGH